MYDTWEVSNVVAGKRAYIFFCSAFYL